MGLIRLRRIRYGGFMLLPAASRKYVGVLELLLDIQRKHSGKSRSDIKCLLFAECVCQKATIHYCVPKQKRSSRYCAWPQHTIGESQKQNEMLFVCSCARGRKCMCEQNVLALIFSEEQSFHTTRTDVLLATMLLVLVCWTKELHAQRHWYE